jgi:hypothetical protein
MKIGLCGIRDLTNAMDQPPFELPIGRSISQNFGLSDLAPIEFRYDSSSRSTSILIKLLILFEFRDRRMPDALKFVSNIDSHNQSKFFITFALLPQLVLI